MGRPVAPEYGTGECLPCRHAWYFNGTLPSARLVIRTAVLDVTENLAGFAGSRELIIRLQLLVSVCSRLSGSLITVFEQFCLILRHAPVIPFQHSRTFSQTVYIVSG